MITHMKIEGDVKMTRLSALLDKSIWLLVT